MTTTKSRGQRLIDWVRLNGAAGCSGEYLKRKLGINNGAILNEVVRQANEILAPTGDGVVDWECRWHIRNLEDYQKDREINREAYANPGTLMDQRFKEPDPDQEYMEAFDGGAECHLGIGWAA